MTRLQQALRAAYLEATRHGGPMGSPTCAELLGVLTPEGQRQLDLALRETQEQAARQAIAPE